MSPLEEWAYWFWWATVPEAGGDIARVSGVGLGGIGLGLGRE